MSDQVAPKCYIYIYVYIYIHTQNQLFEVSVWRGFWRGFGEVSGEVLERVMETRIIEKPKVFIGF